MIIDTVERENRRGNFIVFRFASQPAGRPGGGRRLASSLPLAAARTPHARRTHAAGTPQARRRHATGTPHARAHLVRDANCKLQGKPTFFKAKSSRTLSHICSVAISCILLAYTLCSAGGSWTNTGVP